MQITATEFQQNVGHYFQEARKGTAVLITRSKPDKAVFKLVLEHDGLSGQPGKTGRARKKFSPARINSLIKELGITKSRESGLDFQNRVRS